MLSAYADNRPTGGQPHLLHDMPDVARVRNTSVLVFGLRQKGNNVSLLNNSVAWVLVLHHFQIYVQEV